MGILHPGPADILGHLASTKAEVTEATVNAKGKTSCLRPHFPSRPSSPRVAGPCVLGGSTPTDWRWQWMFPQVNRWKST